MAELGAGRFQKRFARGGSGLGSPCSSIERPFPSTEHESEALLERVRSASCSSTAAITFAQGQ